MSKPKGRLELTWMGKDQALVPAEHGKYDYVWVPREDPRACEVKPIEVAETIGDPDTASDNLMIVGDSGCALRSLRKIPEWRERYLGRVKLVYIDPPFNTEQAFEHYNDQLEHSVWLTMMRDRIRDVKPLLAPDASIWVHLDDAEVHRMRCVLDEELGAENFVATVVWQGRHSRSSDAAVSVSHNFVLVYARDGLTFRGTRNLLVDTDLSGYANPDGDERGPWRSISFTAPNERANLSYEIVAPNGRVHRPPRGRCWRMTADRYAQLVDDERVYFGADGNGVPRIKQFAGETAGLTPNTWWPHLEVGHTEIAAREQRQLHPGSDRHFDTPKPERLLQRIIHIATNPGDLVLDFFAGSGTTAAVAHKMGRRWITVELQESTVEQFTRPRLEKVIAGEDPGGITSRTERVAAGDLPEGMTPDEAKQFTTLLGKATKELGDDEVDKDTIKALRAATKTRDETTTLWDGGGGFTLARLAPSMYEVDDETGEVFLSPHAVNGPWSAAVAGQLGYELTPGHAVFCGRRRRMRLVVVDGVADEQVIRTAVSALGEGERATIVAKAVTDAARSLLGELSPGSRIRKAPADLFTKATIR